MITTNSRKDFLIAEYANYSDNEFQSFDHFKNTMNILIARCEDCRILYWNGCDKRCKCK